MLSPPLNADEPGGIMKEKSVGKKKSSKAAVIVGLVLLAIVVVALAVLILSSLLQKRYTFEYEERADGSYAVTGMTIVGGLSSIETIEFPATYNGKPVREIGQVGSNFIGDVRAVVIPDGVEVIADDAFLRFTGLTSLRLPSTLVSLGSMTSTADAVSLEFSSNDAYRFEGKCLVERETMTVVWAENGCTVPDDIAAIAPYAFLRKQIASFSLPATLKTIGERAFASASGLPATVVIPDTLESVGSCIFAGADGIKTLQLSTHAQIEADAYDEVSFESIVIDVPPIVVGEDADPSAPHAFSITLQPGVEYYIYYNEQIDLVQTYGAETAADIVQRSVESDRAGYRKVPLGFV